MTEETQPNKIDIVKEMVFNECLERKYIRKHQKENRYITNINKKDLYVATISLIPQEIYDELYNTTIKIDIEYVYKLILLILLYKLANNISNISL